MNSSRMHSVVVDTNVILSGIVFGGTPFRVLNLWQKGKILVIVSPKLQAEVTGKLTEKFHVSLHSLKFWNKLFSKASRYVPNEEVILSRDPKDNFLLDLAKVSHADYLITGDKDLLTLKQFEQTSIVTAKDFLDLLK